jgi:hypothetical protein
MYQIAHYLPIRPDHQQSMHCKDDSLTVLRLLRIKNRLGKCRTRKLELVDAILLLDSCLVSMTAAIDSRLLPSPSGGCSRTAGEGGSAGLADSATVDSVSRAGGTGLSWLLIHPLCIPVPRCAPTPARKSSSFRLTLQTIRGHLGSLGRSDCPLKNRTARSRSS